MGAIERVARRARRRVFLSAWLGWLGWLALGAIAASTLLLLADRLGGLWTPWWVYAVLGAAAVAVAWWLAYRGRLSELEAAALLDHRLGLKDRLGSGLYAQRASAEPFSQSVRETGERAAREVKASRAVPLEAGGGWGWVGPAGSVLLVLAVFLPGDVDLFGREAAREREREQAEASEQAAERAEQVRASVRELGRESFGRGDEADELMRRLTSLRDRDLTHPEARREAAGELSDMRQRLSELRQREQRELRAMQNRLSQLDMAESGPADGFHDALRRGDFEAAREELADLREQMAEGGFSEQEREALSRQMAELQEQLAEQAEQAREESAEAERRMAERLEEAGLSEEQVEELAERDFDREAVEEALAESDADEGEAADAAEQVEQDRQARDQAGREAAACEQMGECAGGMAEGAGAGDGERFAQEGEAMDERVGEMAERQDQSEQMEGAEQRMAEAMRQLMEDGPGDEGPADGLDESMARGEDEADGDGAGSAAGDAMTGEPGEAPADREFEAVSEGHEGEGRTVASRDRPRQEGEAEGLAELPPFDESAREARDEAERALSEDRVPRRYHRSIREYFQRLPEEEE